MRGPYFAHASFSVTNAKTLLLLEASASVTARITRVTVTNEDIDSGEQMKIGMSRVATKGSPTGTSITAASVARGNNGDPDPAIVLLSDLTGEPSAYDSGFVDVQGASNLAGYYWRGDLWLPVSGLIGVRLLDNLSAAHTLSTVVEFYEVA